MLNLARLRTLFTSPTDLEPPTLPLPRARWSSRHWFAILSVSLILLLTQGYFAFYPRFDVGADFKIAYTWMVTEPWRLPENAIAPWTLNPLWQNFFMAPFVTMPWPWGYITFVAFTLAVTIYGAYWLGGKPIPTLLSAHMFWVLLWGQLEGWAILALALAWQGMHRKSGWLAFFALALAAFKPQIGFVPVLALWWWSGPSKWKAGLALLAVFIFTLVVWGPWPWWYWQGLTGFLGNSGADLWRASLGPVALPLFLPALLLPMSRYQRVLALAATAQVASPYLPYYSTLLLLCFDVPWWAYLFGVLGYLPNVVGAIAAALGLSQLLHLSPDLIGTLVAWRGTTFLPIGILAWLYAPMLKTWWQTRRTPLPEESPTV